MNILVIDNNVEKDKNTKRLFENLDCSLIDFAKTYDEILIKLSENTIDLVLIDINFQCSQKDCIEIVRFINLPTLYIIDYSNEKMIERSIQTNPLSYIIKPFNQDELKVNIQLAKYKLTLKNKLKHSNRIELGYGYYCDKTLDELFFYDMLVPLGKNEKKLLKLLLNYQGNIVSNKSIEEEVWGSKIVSDNTRRNLIYRLRTKLEYKLIETIPDVGCRLIVH